MGSTTPQPTTTTLISHPVILSVIVANFNGQYLLRLCLDSIYRHPPACSFHVVVIDDASSDGSAEMVEECFAQAHLLRNETNVHYGRSNNRALNLVMCRYVCLLNNDTVILPYAFDRMIEFLDTHPTAGAVGCKLLNDDGTIQASVKTLPCAMSGLFGHRSIITKVFPRNRVSRKHLLHLSHDMSRPFTAGYVSSAAIMIRHEVIEKIGYLDERLSYHVDADYCKRIWDAGWEVYYLPSATIIHDAHKGGTMLNRKRRFQSIVEFHRGSYIYFRKHHMKFLWHPMHLITVVGLGARFLVSLLFQILQELRRRRMSDACYEQIRAGSTRKYNATK